MYYIVAYMPRFKKSILKELAQVDENFKVVKQLSQELAFIQTDLTQTDFTSKLLENDPIFIKHIAPVNKIIPTFHSKESMQKGLALATEDITDIHDQCPFSVQARVLGGKSFGLDYNSKDVEVAVGEYFCQHGQRGIPVFSDQSLLKKDDARIISLCITPEQTFIGFSLAKENLNFHHNEYRICSREGGREVSRAENKLKEAIAKFSLQLPGGKALDIGAAPGGWTKVLLDNGYDVVAVDPGKLVPELENNPRVDHQACRIEKLNFQNCFDIIVNDMNMDPAVSAEIMCGLSQSLKENGQSVLTVKLPGNPERGIAEAREVLKKKYDILKTKNLFHNRQEVTMLLRKKSSGR